MAIINGSSIMLYQLIGGSYLPIGYSRSVTLNLEANPIDVTVKESGGWSESLMGTRSFSFDIEGLTFFNTAIATETAQNVMSDAINRTKLLYVMTDAIGSSLTPRFNGFGYITSMSLEAPNEDVSTYSATIQGTEIFETQGLLLDIATAGGAYSLRKLSASYSGSLIRVRRSSDNTEQDFGYSANNGLDQAALISFVGAGNGFVTTWYDQSGNNRHFVQATAGNQPSIVTSGVVNTDLGKPCLLFDGSNDQFQLEAASRDILKNVGYATLVSVRKYTALPSTVKGIIDIGNGTGLTRAEMSNTAGNLRISSGRRLDANSVQSATSVGTVGTTTTLAISEFQYANALLNQYTNGVLDGTNPAFQTAGNTSDTNSTYAYIGRTIVGGTTPFNGTMSEVIIYNTNTVALRPEIEANINAYYGIY
jgi:predicted secreted protein